MSIAAEHNPSLWMATTGESGFGALASEGDQRADVIVVGAGITGLTTARLLAGDGLDVAVIDAGEVASGVTGFTTAKVTALQSTIYSTLCSVWDEEVAATYATANQEAIRLVRRLTSEDDIECDLVAAPSYTYAEQADGLGQIEAEVDAATRAGLPVAFTTDTDLPYGVAGAVRLDDQAHFHPRRYCLGLANAVAKAGGRIFERTRVLDVDFGARRVQTDRGALQADAIVLATHLPFVKRGAHFARVEPSRSYAVAVKAPDAMAAPQGMYISVDSPVRSLRPALGEFVIVGGEGHKVGAEPDTAARYQALESWTATRFAGSTPRYRWSAQDYMSTDHLPFVGLVSSGSERVYAATGYSKCGMTNGTVAAMILSDLIQGRENAWAATYDSTRFAARQGARGALKANVDVAKRFVGDRLASLHAPSIHGLRPGEGSVADLDGHKVAAFRDEDGTLHAVSPTCTHLGCQVTFNDAERSWDCPCHGSRFDVDGRVLQGPAVVDLAMKEVESVPTGDLPAPDA